MEEEQNSTSLVDKAENFGSSFGFLVPLLIPWMQELCAESATLSMRILYQLPETTIPYQLIPKTSLKFETIRDSIIPQLFKFINSTPDPHKYLTDRFNYYYMEDTKQNNMENDEEYYSSTSSSSSSDCSSSSHSSSSSMRKRKKRNEKKQKHIENKENDKINEDNMDNMDNMETESIPNRRQLTERRLELFVSSLISDLITYAHYQRQNMMNNDDDESLSENDFLNNMLPLELSMIIQYIKMLIWEYHESILMVNIKNEEDNDDDDEKHNNSNPFKLNYIYDETLCCNSLLTILNHEYTHQLLIERLHRNVADFGMFAEYLHENAKELSNLKKTNQEKQNQIKQLKDQINDLKKKQEDMIYREIHHTRPSSQSVPQRGPKSQHSQNSMIEKPTEPPLPIIERIDIETLSEEMPPPPRPQKKSLWQPLQEVYELFEPRGKNRKKFQRIRDGEEIPKPPKRGPPPVISKKKPTKRKPTKPKPTKFKDKSKIIRKPKPTKNPPTSPTLKARQKTLDPNYKISIQGLNPNNNKLTPTSSTTTPTNFDEHDGNNSNSNNKGNKGNKSNKGNKKNKKNKNNKNNKNNKSKKKNNNNKKEVTKPKQINNNNNSGKKKKKQSIDTVNDAKPPQIKGRRTIRTMTLSRPAKLESLSKDEFMGKYLVETSKIIGQGSFAKIYRCKKKNKDEILAMKIVKKQKANKDDVRAMRREISALALVYHKNVIRIHDWCETPQHIFIVLDYCAGGNVFDRVMEQQTFTEIQASKLIKQVASALKHLHSLGIVHRDLKPENLMYVGPHDNTMKVIDFGLSNRIKINGMFISQSDFKRKNINPQQVFSLETPCGTPHYAAPELVKNQKYGAPVDLWALGVITYMLLCGFPPFFDTNIKNMFSQIKKAKFHFPSPFWDTISNEAKDLIKKLLVVDAKKRYTAIKTLNHPWITGEIFADDTIQQELIDNVPLPPELPDSDMEDVKNNIDANHLNMEDIKDNPSEQAPEPSLQFNTEQKNNESEPPLTRSPVLTSAIPTYGGGKGVLSPVVSSPNSLQDISSDAGHKSDAKSEVGSVVIHTTATSPRHTNKGGGGNKDGVLGTPIVDIDESTKHDIRIDVLSPKKQSSTHLQSPEVAINDNELRLNRAYSDPIQALQTPPVPFHVDSELFPASNDMTNFALNDEKERGTPLLRKAHTSDGIKTIKTVKTKKGRRARVDTRGTTNVAYMVDGTIFQIQKQQINKLKLEIQTEQQNLEKLSNKLQIERQIFMQERESFDREKQEWYRQKEEWMNEHQHLLQLKLQLNDVINKFLTFNKNGI